MNCRPSFSRVVALCALVLTAIGSDRLRAEDGPPGEGTIRSLVARLAAESYEEREAATERLWALGLAALPALREAAKSDDPEVSVRARTIVQRLELGIFADTPQERVDLIERYHTEGRAGKEAVLRQLRGDDDLPILLRLILSERDPKLRAELVEKFAGAPDKVFEGLRKLGEDESVGELLALVSPRDWAVYLLLQDRAEEALAELRAQWIEDAEAVDPEPLFWLLVFTGRLAEAREVAERSDEDSLRREVYLRQGDWKAVAGVADRTLGKNPVEQWGFRIMFAQKAGDEAAAREGVENLVNAMLDDGTLERHRALSLIILGRWDLAAKCYGREDELDAQELSFHIERLDLERAFSRLGAEPSGRGTAEVVRKRVAAVTEMGKQREAAAARRELHYLCRSAAELLVRIGEREEARQVFAAMIDLLKEDESSYLGYLAGTCRRAGFEEVARRMGLEALEAGAVLPYLSSRFGSERGLAQLFWDHHRATAPEEPVEEVLRHVEHLMESADDTERGRVLAEAVKWSETCDERARAGYWKALGDDARDRRDWEAAARAYRQQSELERDPALPLIEAGVMFMKLEQWKKAATWFGEAVEAGSGSELALYLLGHALRKNGAEEKGAALQAEAVLLPLGNSNRRNSFAYALSRQGLAEEAREQWELILETGVRDRWDGVEAWGVRNACTQLTRRRAAESPGLAAELQERYLYSFLMTNSSMTSRYYLIYRAQIDALQFKAHMAAGEIEQAIAAARRALANRPGLTNFVIEADEQLRKAGRDEVADEMHEALAARYRRLVERYPNSAQDHNSLAWLRGRSGRDLEEALRHAEKAVALGPDDPEYLDTLAEVCFRRGDRAKAVELAKRCRELAPEEDHYRDQLARFGEE